MSPAELVELARLLRVFIADPDVNPADEHDARQVLAAVEEAAG